MSLSNGKKVLSMEQVVYEVFSPPFFFLLPLIISAEMSHYNQVSFLLKSQGKD